MKNNQIKITALALNLIMSSLIAQISNYSFTQTTGAYGAVNTGSLVGNTMQDDDITQVSLPFAFKFNDTIYNGANVSSNGFISFGSQQINTYKPISGHPQNLVSPFGQDLVMGLVTSGDITAGSNTITNVLSTAGIQVGDSLFDYTFNFGGQSPIITSINGNDIVVSVFATNSSPVSDLFILNGSIKQNVLGAAPNRICEFEYRNFSRFSVYNDKVNFKVRFYETSNKIEFVYGVMQPGVTLSGVEVGLRGTATQDFNSRVVNTINSWTNSLASVQITDSCSFSQANFPPSHLSYQWTPISCIQPSLSMATSHSTICIGQTATLTAAGALSYTWSTGVISNKIVISPSLTTTYSVIGVSTNCSSTLSIQQLVSKCTDIEDLMENQSAVKMYPNPFQFELNLENNDSQNFEYNLCDINGNIIISGQLRANSKENLKAPALKPGLYFITLNDNRKTVYKKIIKH